LGGLAGVYGGRRITIRDGELYFERRDGKTARLLPLSEDGLFTVAGYDDHFRIRLTGTAMEMHWIDEPAPTRLARDR
jgi:hypothetical protein